MCKASQDYAIGLTMARKPIDYGLQQNKIGSQGDMTCLKICLMSPAIRALDIPVCGLEPRNAFLANPLAVRFAIR